MASPLHRLIPWLRRPVRTCLRSIPISLPWQQGLLYPICTRLMAREGGKMCNGTWLLMFFFLPWFCCWWWWCSDRADDRQYFPLKIMHPDMSVKSRRRHLQHFDQDSFFRTSFHLWILFFSPELAKKDRCFLGKRVRHFPDPRRIWSISRNTSDSFYETCKLLFSYTDPQGRPAGLLSQEWRGFVSCNEIFSSSFHPGQISLVETMSCVSPLEVSFRVGSLAFSVWLASNPHCVSSCARE